MHKMIYVVMTRANGDVVNQSNQMHSTWEGGIATNTLVELIRSWSRPGFEVGDTFTIKEVEGE